MKILGLPEELFCFIKLSLNNQEAHSRLEPLSFSDKDGLKETLIR